MKQEKQITFRNICWNKHYENVLKDSNSDECLKYAEDLLSQLKEDSRISYCIFAIERGKDQNENSFHFQGYLEFNTKVDVRAFNKKFGVFGESRQGTQQQAIDYVKKERTKLTNQLFEFGNLKGKTAKIPFIPLYDVDDPEIPPQVRHQEVLIDERLSTNYYQNFSDLKKSFRHIFIKQESWLKNLWNKYHPINQLDVKQACVIWLYGEGGAGKTTWTRKYLRAYYQDSDIATISPQNITYSEKIYFALEHENCKVLIINEVDKNFPKHNNLISFIDRNTLLATKGSYIRNNFELIIINSVYRPESVFSYLGKKTASQAIRRIYNKFIDSRVYHVIKNQDQLDKIVSEQLVFHSDAQFQDWYQVIMHRIEEPDYSLISSLDREDDELLANNNNIESVENESSFLARLKGVFTKVNGKESI